MSGTVRSAPNEYKKLKREDYGSDDSYHEAIKNYIDNRTILKDYFHIDPKDCFVLFRLKGIKGEAQYISGSIIRFLIEKYRITNIGIEELLINISSKYDEFKLNIDNEIKKLKS